MSAKASESPAIGVSIYETKALFTHVCWERLRFPDRSIQSLESGWMDPAAFSLISPNLRPACPLTTPPIAADTPAGVRGSGDGRQKHAGYTDT